MDRVTIHTIELVFTDGSSMEHSVLGMDIEPVFEEAERHFMATHLRKEATLSHLLIHNADGVTIACWEGVALSS